MSNSNIGQLKPWFELKGKAARIELSAWLAMLSYFVGLLLVGQDRLLNTHFFSLFLVVACFVVFLFSVVAIQRHMGFAASANTFGKPNQLVTSGLFQMSRNPIYLAFWLPLLSLCVLWWPAGFIALAIYVFTMNVTVLRTEERDLSNLFGQTYLEYAAKVPRWIFWK